MELSPSSNPSIDGPSRPSRTKSGRVSKKPEALSPSSSTKRKRDNDADDAEDSDQDVDMQSEHSEEQDVQDDNFEEEVVLASRRKKRSSAGKAKPAAKKSKPNTASATLAIRGGKGKQKQPPKPRNSSTNAAEGAIDLYSKRDPALGPHGLLVADCAFRERVHRQGLARGRSGRMAATLCRPRIERSRRSRELRLTMYWMRT